MDQEPWYPDRQSPQEPRRHAAVMVVLVAAAAVAAGLLWWRGRQPAPLPATPVAPPAAPALPEIDAGEPPPPAPPANIDAATALRRAAGGLSRRAEWARWLDEAQLISRLAAAARRVAEGENPRPLLLFLAPDGPFTVVSRGDERFAAPRTYARYDLVTGILTAIDPVRAARVYGRLAPYFEAAYREIARPGERFTPVLHQAVRELLATPVPVEAPELNASGSTFFYADPALERLAPPQKQLLRMGPENARALHRWLAAFDRALPAR